MLLTIHIAKSTPAVLLGLLLFEGIWSRGIAQQALPVVPSRKP